MEKVTRVISHGVLLSKFKHDIDMSASLLSSALEREHSFSYHLMSELAGALDQHGIADLGTVVQAASESANKVPEMLTWWKVFKTVLYSTLSLAGLAGWLVFRFRQPILQSGRGCVRHLRNRLDKRHTVVASTSVGQSIEGSGSEPNQLVRVYPDTAVFVKSDAPGVKTVPVLLQTVDFESWKRAMLR